MEKTPREGSFEAPYIVIDGLDGSGKTTQLRLLTERAKREGRAYMLTREPGGAPLSEALRDLFKSKLGEDASSLTQSLMMWASRRNYLEKIVWPSLDKGVPVLSDRGDASTLAYQVYANETPELENEFWRMRSLVFNDRPPTLYIIVAVSPEVAHARVHGDSSRGELSHFDAKGIEFYRRVEEGFNAFAHELPNVVKIIDGNRTPDEIHKDIYRLVAGVCSWIP